MKKKYFLVSGMKYKFILNEEKIVKVNDLRYFFERTNESFINYKEISQEEAVNLRQNDKLQIISKDDFYKTFVIMKDNPLCTSFCCF